MPVISGLWFGIATRTAMLALLAATGWLAPLPAFAAGTSNWNCNVRADAPQTLVLKGADFARPTTDRRMVDLECSFNPTMPGPSQVTLCIAAPYGANGGGPARALRRRGGTETIGYRLSAQPGNVASALPFPISALMPTPQPLYTATIEHGDAGTMAYRLEFALLTEIQGLAGRILPEGEYGDTLTGLSTSIHEGRDCGFLLWGPPMDSLGSIAELAPTLTVPAACSISVANAINFGLVPSTATAIRDAGALAVQCSPGTRYLLELGDGNDPAGGTRRMGLLGPTGQGIRNLAYELLKPDGTRWAGTATKVPGSPFAGTGDGTVQAIVVTGQIPAGTPLPMPGEYRDSVIVTLDY